MSNQTERVLEDAIVELDAAIQAVGGLRRALDKAGWWMCPPDLSALADRLHTAVTQYRVAFEGHHGWTPPLECPWRGFRVVLELVQLEGEARRLIRWRNESDVAAARSRAFNAVLDHDSERNERWRDLGLPYIRTVPVTMRRGIRGRAR